MALITWTDDFSVGVDSIDEQHKKLVNMVNALDDALANDEVDETIHNIFDGLAVYVITHFDYEEELFEQYNYPQSDEHKEEHRALKEQAAKLQKDMEDGDFMVSIEVLSFLKDWLTNHILVSDMAYSDFFIEKGVQ